MMNFTPSQTHSRHEIVDRVIARTQQFVNRHETAQEFGASFVSGFNSMAANYVVPDIRHGVLELSQEQQSSGGHAITAVGMHEDIRVGKSFASLDQAQLSSLKTLFEEWNLQVEDTQEVADFLEPMLAASHDKSLMLSTLADNMAGARVTTAKATLQNDMLGQSFLLRGRGALLIGAELVYTGMFAETDMLHEWVHQVQITSTPLLPLENSSNSAVVTAVLETEVDAYAAQGKAILIKKAGGYALDENDEVILELPAMIPQFIADSKTRTVDPVEIMDNWIVSRTKQLTRRKTAA
jgi:hypothetical protein